MRDREERPNSGKAKAYLERAPKTDERQNAVSQSEEPAYQAVVAREHKLAYSTLFSLIRVYIKGGIGRGTVNLFLDPTASRLGQLWSVPDSAL
jgi:hypothetical protein